MYNFRIFLKRARASATFPPSQSCTFLMKFRWLLVDLATRFFEEISPTRYQGFLAIRTVRGEPDRDAVPFLKLISIFAPSLVLPYRRVPWDNNRLWTLSLRSFEFSFDAPDRLILFLPRTFRRIFRLVPKTFDSVFFRIFTPARVQGELIFVRTVQLAITRTSVRRFD